MPSVVPFTEPEQILNRAIGKVRITVERAFGALKRDYGFERTHYLGCAKVKPQLILLAMAFNLRKAALMARA